jgi:hypothetical protein
MQTYDEKSFAITNKLESPTLSAVYLFSVYIVLGDFGLFFTVFIGDLPDYFFTVIL